MGGIFMRTFYESLALCVRNRWRMKPFVRITIGCITLVFISCSLVTQTFGGAIDWRLIKDVSLDDPPIDIATTQDGSHIFILTANAILVYARKDDKIINRIPVDKVYDKISFSKARNEFVLTSAASKSLNIIKIYPIVQINTEGLPFLGPLNAPVSVVVFDDYQCTACTVLDQILKDVVEMYREEVKLVIKHFPNSDHPFSIKAAVAARAAHAQGKFWEFHRALFEKQASLNDNTIQSIATQLALDMTKFNRDLKSQNITAMVNRDLWDGRQLDIKVTPTVFINGKYLERRGLEDISDMIEAELKKQPSG